jgi:hypothetical protein
MSLAIEAKNALLSLTKTLRSQADHHIEEQRKIIAKQRRDAEQYFEQVQERIGVAISSKVLQEASKAFSSSESHTDRNHGLDSSLNIADTTVGNRLKDEIHAFVASYKDKVVHSIEAEMETALQSKMLEEEEYVNARRRYWRDLADKDAENTHMVLMQQQLLHLSSEDESMPSSNSPSSSNNNSTDKSFLNHLAQLRPQDFLESARKYNNLLFISYNNNDARCSYCV